MKNTNIKARKNILKVVQEFKMFIQIKAIIKIKK